MPVSREINLFGCVDDTMVINRTRAELITKTADFITAAKSMGLGIKTKPNMW